MRSTLRPDDLRFLCHHQRLVPIRFDTRRRLDKILQTTPTVRYRKSAVVGSPLKPEASAPRFPEPIITPTYDGLARLQVHTVPSTLRFEGFATLPDAHQAIPQLPIIGTAFHCVEGQFSKMP